MLRLCFLAGLSPAAGDPAGPSAPGLGACLELELLFVLGVWLVCCLAIQTDSEVLGLDREEKHESRNCREEFLWVSVIQLCTVCSADVSTDFWFNTETASGSQIWKKSLIFRSTVQFQEELKSWCSRGTVIILLVDAFAHTQTALLSPVHLKEAQPAVSTYKKMQKIHMR